MRQHQFPLSTMYIEELWSLRTTKCGDSVVQMIRNIPSFQACQSSFYRNRAKTTPKLRTSQKEINLDQLEKNSSSVTTLYPGTQKWQNPDIFNGLKHSMCAAETMLSDGTFYSRTKLLTQIYTLHAPLWALPNKIDGTYSRFFALLKYVQYVNSSLSYRLNIGNWTSISM